MKLLLAIVVTFILLIPLSSYSQVFIRGDINDDGDVDIEDLCALQCLRFGACNIEGTDCDSAEIRCVLAADINDDGVVSLVDVTYMTGFLFQSGSQPPPPYPDCGEDPTNPQAGDDCCSFIGCCEDWGLPGDANSDNFVDLLDVFHAIDYVYTGWYGIPHNPDWCNDLLNADGIGIIDLLDILHIIAHVYEGEYGIPPNVCP